MNSKRKSFNLVLQVQVLHYLHDLLHRGLTSWINVVPDRSMEKSRILWDPHNAFPQQAETHLFDFDVVNPDRPITDLSKVKHGIDYRFPYAFDTLVNDAHSHAWLHCETKVLDDRVLVFSCLDEDILELNLATLRPSPSHKILVIRLHNVLAIIESSEFLNHLCLLEDSSDIVTCQECIGEDDDDLKAQLQSQCQQPLVDLLSHGNAEGGGQ